MALFASNRVGRRGIAAPTHHFFSPESLCSGFLFSDLDDYRRGFFVFSPSSSFFVSSVIAAGGSDKYCAATCKHAA
jgi:hypothetical protein